MLLLSSSLPSSLSSSQLLFFWLAVFPSSFVLVVAGEVVLSENLMELTLTSALLCSNLVGDDNNREERSSSSSPPSTERWKHFEVFSQEGLNPAAVAKRSGYCYAAFGGTSTLTWDDWNDENGEAGVVTQEVCVDIHKDGTDTDQACCKTRKAFWDAYNTDYRGKMEAAIRHCAKDCTHKDECVVLTGHSQGGAVAAIAALHLADLNPYVITFGQPPTLAEPCPLVTSERWYRYINSKATSYLNFGIVYDPVPFVPRLERLTHFGHMLLLSEDNSGVAYIGLDVHSFFGPLRGKGFAAHSMVAAEGSEYPGYLDRIRVLLHHYENETFPIRTSGFVPGSLCTEDIECSSRHCVGDSAFGFKRCVEKPCVKDEDCGSGGRCDSGVCLAKAGSCNVCGDNSDCASGTCAWNFRCTGENDLMDDNCFCSVDSDCRSGRCGGILPRVCEPQLKAGATCNEGSDCLSGRCSWRHRCTTESSTIPALLRSVNDEPARSDETIIEEETIDTGITEPEQSSVTVVEETMDEGTLDDQQFIILDDDSIVETRAPMYISYTVGEMAAETTDDVIVDDQDGFFDDDYSILSKEGTRTPMLLSYSVGAIAAFFFIIWICFCRNRSRRGYEEIPEKKDAKILSVLTA